MRRSTFTANQAPELQWLVGGATEQLVDVHSYSDCSASWPPFGAIHFHAFLPGMQIVAPWYQYLDAKALRSQRRTARPAIIRGKK
jgi:hypothetical protein